MLVITQTCERRDIRQAETDFRVKLMTHMDYTVYTVQFRVRDLQTCCRAIGCDSYPRIAGGRLQRLLQYPICKACKVLMGHGTFFARRRPRQPL